MSSNLKALRVIIGNAHWNDLQRPPECCLAVEEIYLMIRPATINTINIEHVMDWLSPILFPALRSFTIFQEYGVNSKVMVQLPFTNGPAIFQTRSVTNIEEFWESVSFITGLSHFDY